MKDFDFRKMLVKWHNDIERGAQAELARKLNVTTAMVAFWVTGRQKPGEENLKKIAKLFGVNLADLKTAFGIEDKEFSRSFRTPLLTPQNTITLPILANVPAGLPEFSEKDVEGTIDVPRWIYPDADFIVKCNGDSLEPKLHFGDLCVIRKMEEPLNGRAMLVKTEHGVCMKVIKKLSDGHIQLCSTNPKYEPFIPEELVIVGLIIGSWSRQDNENWLGLTERK